MAYKNSDESIASVQIGDKIQRATGSGVISEVVDFTQENGKILQIDLHLSGASNAENLTVTLNSAEGAVYDLVMFSQDLDGATDISITDQWYVAKGDSVTVAYPNSAGNTFGLQIHYAV